MKRLRWYDYLSINLFWLGLNIRNTAVGSVFTPYLVALFVPTGRQNTALGAISTAGLIIAMLVQPAAGILSDRSTSRFGRRRPFIFFGVLFDVLFLVAIGLSGNFWMLLVATLLIQFSANVSHGPLQASSRTWCLKTSVGAPPRSKRCWSWCRSYWLGSPLPNWSARGN